MVEWARGWCGVCQLKGGGCDGWVWEVTGTELMGGHLDRLGQSQIRYLL